MEPPESFNRLKEAFISLQLDSLPRDWVNDWWNSNFSDERELPSEFTADMDTNCLVGCLSEVLSTMKIWYKQGRPKDPSSGLRSWSSLHDFEISCESLVCLLNYFIKPNILDGHDHSSIMAALNSAEIYIYLIGSPGALLLNIFKESIFDKALGLLKVGNLIDPGSKKSKKSKSKKKDNSDDNAVGRMTGDEIKEIVTGLCSLLKAFSDILEVIRLNELVLALNGIIRSLAEFTTFEAATNVFTLPPTPNTTAQAVLIAYTILKKLCQSQHGHSTETIEIIFITFSSIVSQTEDEFSTDINVDDTNRRSHVFSFLLKVLEEHEKESIDLFIGFMQQLLVRSPDRAEPRERLVNEMFQVITQWPPPVAKEFNYWLLSFFLTEKVKHRIFAIELVAKLLNYKDVTENDRMHELYVSAVIDCCIDKFPLVRYKCLNILAHCIVMNRPEVKSVMDSMFNHPKDFDDNSLFDPKSCLCYSEFVDANYSDPDNLVLPEVLLPPAHQVIKMLEKFRLDDRVYVRKNALSALTNILLFHECWLSPSRLQALERGCIDTSIMIRKLMMKNMTDVLLKYPDKNMVIGAWVDAILPLTFDPDSKCQDKVIEILFDILIKNIEAFENTNNDLTKLPWKILDKIILKDKVQNLKPAFRTWAHLRLIEDQVFQDIVTHIDTENNYSAWILIRGLSEFLDYPRPTFIFSYFFDKIYLKENSSGKPNEYVVLESVFLNRKGLTKDHLEEIFLRFQSGLESYSIPVPLIGLCMDIIYSIKPLEVREWCKNLIEDSGSYIMSLFAPGNSCPINAYKLCKYIYTFGEAASLWPEVSPESVKCIAFIMQSDLSKRTQRCNVNVRAVCVLTLGKLCLQDIILAKKYVPMLVLLLTNQNSGVVIKTNALHSLTDLSIRFTSVVEDYVNEICLSLKDTNKDIRLTALVNITQLVMEDYLKLRSPLFFFLLTMMLDPASEVRDTYQAFIKNCALKKNPGVLSSFFVKTIFFFNNFEGENGIDKSKFSVNEQRCFGLEGVKNFKRREFLYEFMLETMGDEQRFRVLHGLVRDVLERVCDDKIKLDKIGNAVLKDTLNTLASKAMRLENLHKDDGDQPVEDTRCEDYVLGMAKKIIINQLLKKSYMESFVPVVGRLKRKLYGLKSPLAQDLMICVREIMKDFKKEVDEIFGNDPELAAEVAFDLQDVESDEPCIFGELEDAHPEVQTQVAIISQMAVDESLHTAFDNNEDLAEDLDNPLSPPRAPRNSIFSSIPAPAPRTPSPPPLDVSSTKSKFESVSRRYTPPPDMELDSDPLASESRSRASNSGSPTSNSGSQTSSSTPLASSPPQESVPKKKTRRAGRKRKS